PVHAPLGRRQAVVPDATLHARPSPEELRRPVRARHSSRRELSRRVRVRPARQGFQPGASDDARRVDAGSRAVLRVGAREPGTRRDRGGGRLGHSVRRLLVAAARRARGHSGAAVQSRLPRRHHHALRAVGSPRLSQRGTAAGEPRRDGRRDRSHSRHGGAARARGAPRADPTRVPRCRPPPRALAVRGRHNRHRRLGRRDVRHQALTAHTDEHEENLERLARLAHAAGVDGVLLAAHHNIAWLTSGRHNRIDNSRETGSARLLVAADGRRFVLGNAIEMPRLLGEVLAGLAYEPIEYPWTDDPDPAYAVRVARGLLKAGAAIAADWPLPDTTPAEPRLMRARALLTGGEIARYRRLGRDAGLALEHVCQTLTPGDVELDI